MKGDEGNWQEMKGDEISRYTNDLNKIDLNWTKTSGFKNKKITSV